MLSVGWATYPLLECLQVCMAECPSSQARDGSQTTAVGMVLVPRADEKEAHCAPLGLKPKSLAYGLSNAGKLKANVESCAR